MSKINQDVMDWFWGWNRRMSKKYGATCYGKRNVDPYYGYDWGQALCVEQYGKDNSNWPDEPSKADMERADRWENGEWPDWANQPSIEEEGK